MIISYYFMCNVCGPSIDTFLLKIHNIVSPWLDCDGIHFTILKKFYKSLRLECTNNMQSSKCYL